MQFRTPGLVALIICMLLMLQDAEAARRSLRVDFGAWDEALPFEDFRCEGGFKNGLDIIWRGHQFSATANTEFKEDTYCQVTSSLNEDVFGPDEDGLAAMIGSNDSEDLSKRVTARRYTFLNQDRFSEDPLPEGFQWGFYFFPGDLTLATIYGEIPVGSNGFEPIIYNHYGTVWDSGTEGYDGEYFCFEGSLFIGTWDGVLSEPGAESRCELLLGELIFDTGFEKRPPMNGNGFFNHESGPVGEEWPIYDGDGWPISEYPRFLADFDDDGESDLVMRRDGVDNIYLNTGEWRPFYYAAQIGFDCSIGCRVMAVDDMDGSGNPDLVLGLSGEPNQLLLNNGSESPFEEVTRLNIGGVAFPSAVAVGDIDGDGNLDLAMASFGEPIRVYINNASGDPFADVVPIEISPGGEYVSNLFLTDINNDGDEDILYSRGFRFVSDVPAVLLNNGTSNPFAGVEAMPLDVDIESMAPGDMNGDGYVDLVIETYDTILLYLNNGTLTPFSGVTGKVVYSEHLNGNYSHFALGDVNGDGAMDMAVACDYLPPQLFLNNGTADPFAAVRGLYITSESPHIGAYFLLDNVDNDGKLDLLIGGLPEARTYMNQD